MGELFVIAAAGAVIALAVYIIFDLARDDDDQIASRAALKDFGAPLIWRFDATPDTVKDWRRWLEKKYRWASQIQDRQWRRVNLKWCAYYERQIDKAQREWQEDRDVDALAKARATLSATQRDDRG